MKPFINAEIVKECMLQSVNILLGNKKETIERFRHIQKSTSTNTRNIKVMTKNNHEL